MPNSFHLFTAEERLEVMRRLQLVLLAKIHERTGGRRGSVKAESLELADECGCSEWAIQRYMGWNGPLARSRGGTSLMARVTYLPRFDVLMRVAQVTGASLDWMAFGKGAVPHCVKAYEAYQAAMRPGQAA